MSSEAVLSPRMSRAIALLLAALVAIAPGVARAQGESADALIDQGVSLRERGRDAEALALFERARALEPSGRALAQIALAEQALGRFAEAESHLAAALDSATADRFVRRNRSLLEQALAEIRAHVGELEVRGPDGAELVAGRARATLPLDAPLRVSSGTVHVAIRAEGYEPFEADVEVVPGGRAELAPELAPIAATPPPPEPAPVLEPAPPPPPHDDGGIGWMLPTGIAAAGVGVVGLAIGAGLSVVREDRAQARQRCTDDEPGCRDLYSAAVDAETGAIVGYVVGGALAAAGATLIVLELLGVTRERDESLGTLRVSCAPSPLGIACAGRF